MRLDRDGFAPTLILFPTTTPTLDADVAAVAVLKQRYRAPMFCYGPHASTTPGESMARAAAVDGMFVGEPEDAALQLAALDSLDRLGEVPSLTWRRQGAIVPHRAHGSFAGFLDAPYPAWDLLALDRYSLPMVNKPYVLVETSRGCPYTCDFCVAPIHQGHKFRERSPKQLVDQIERSYRELGIEFFYLWGDTVTLNVKSFTAFCDELIARNLPIQWFGNARADNLTDPAFVHRLKRAGCWMLALGIESESEEIRKDMVKRLERKKIETAFGNMRDGRDQVVRLLHLRLPRRNGPDDGPDDEVRDRARSGLRQLLPGRARTRAPRSTRSASATGCCARRTPTGRRWSTPYYLLRGNGLDDRIVMESINRAKRRFFLRPGVRDAPRRRRRQAGDDEAGDRVAGAVAHDVRRPRRGHPARPPGPAAGHDDYVKSSGAIRR